MFVVLSTSILIISSRGIASVMDNAKGSQTAVELPKKKNFNILGKAKIVGRLSNTDVFFY